MLLLTINEAIYVLSLWRFSRMQSGVGPSLTPASSRSLPRLLDWKLKLKTGLT
jgi:hypothetical protein